MTDLFDVLDVSLREDTYSSMIVHIFKWFPEILAGVFEELTGKKIVGKRSVKFRAQIGGDNKNRPDILVTAEIESGEWWLVIEAKVQSGEGHEQTRRYATLCETAQVAKKCGGSTLIYLTLAGDNAEMDAGCMEAVRWCSKTHLELARLIEKFDVGQKLQSDLVIAAPWRAYIARLEHYEQLESPKDDQRILEWLAKPGENFISQDERASVLAKSIFPNDLQRKGVVYPGKGQSQFLSQAFEVGWNIGYYRGDKGQRLVDCVCVHYELSFPLGHTKGGVTCHLHFECYPYMPESKIETLGEAKRGFKELRDFMRKQLHDRLKETGWKTSNHKLQMAKLTYELIESTTVGEMKAFLALHISASREKINAALKVTARELGLNWTQKSQKT